MTATSGGQWFETPQECIATFDPSIQQYAAGIDARGWYGRRWADGGMGFTGITFSAPPNQPSCAWNAHDAQPGMYPPGSYHPGGVNVALADGSTRFIRDNINAGNPSANMRLGGLTPPSPFGILGAMGTRSSNDMVTFD